MIVAHAVNKIFQKVTAVTWPSFHPSGFVTQWKLRCQAQYLMAVSNFNQNFCFCFVCYSLPVRDSGLAFPTTKTTNFSRNSINCYDSQDFDVYLIYLPAEATLFEKSGGKVLPQNGKRRTDKDVEIEGRKVSSLPPPAAKLGNYRQRSFGSRINIQSAMRSRFSLNQ